MSIPVLPEQFKQFALDFEKRFRGGQHAGPVSLKRMISLSTGIDEDLISDERITGTDAYGRTEVEYKINWPEGMEQVCIIGDDSQRENKET